MATSVIPNPNQVETATMGGTPATGQVTYHKRQVTKYEDARVHIELSCKFSVDIGAGTQIASIPAGYRPKSAIHIPAIMNSTSVWFAGYVKIESDGVISQGLTGYMREVVVDGWYNI